MDTCYQKQQADNMTVIFSGAGQDGQKCYHDKSLITIITTQLNYHFILP